MKLTLTTAERHRRTFGTLTMRERPAIKIHDRRHRDFDRVQDNALYKCGCGMSFDAPVTASVGCPHCGERQAW